MAGKGEQFAGLTVALVTPFRNGQVDEAALRKLVDFHVEAGTDCVSPVGTTGESPTLSHDEHERVIAIVCEQAAGRIKVMAGTGSNNTAEAVRLTKFAQKAGATAALMVAPYYNKPTQEGFFQHYKAVTEQVDLPIVLYNIPGRTGITMTPQTVARLYEHPNIIAIKEATGSLDMASEIMSLCGITVVSGDDSLTIPLMSIGGKGVISVLSNLMPAAVKSITKNCLDGKFADAAKTHLKLFPLVKSLFLDGNPVGVKYAMKVAGTDSGQLRLPLWEASDATKKTIEAAMKAAGAPFAA
jgi:4-hydroxy-tetrahydrodipicolinate synthase